MSGLPSGAGAPRRRRAASVLLGMALMVAVGAHAQTMNRALAPMNMEPAGPGGMWESLRKDTLAGSPGLRLYREGVLPGYRAAVATRAGNPVGPDQLACANCHGRSGLGSREGGQTVPSIVPAALFAPRATAPARPAYTDATLAAALQQGVDPAGRELSPVMPRYTLTADEFASLTQYLRTLTPVPSAGVRDGVLHLATVVTEGADPVQRKAMLDVLQAGLADINRAAGADALRWDLQVWDLSGAVDARRAQLEAYQTAQPVAVLLGGLAPEDFLPVHQFCERHRVPCVFPETPLPAVEASGYFSLYFDQGLNQEGRVLAQYLRQHGEDFRAGPIVQLGLADWSGFVPAAALRRGLGRAGAARRVIDRTIDAAAAHDPAFWRALLEREHPSALVLWLENPELAAIAAAVGTGEPPQIFLSGRLRELRPAAQPPALAGARVHVVSLRRTDADPAARKAWSSWLDAHHLAPVAGSLQADAWFALRVLQDAVARSGPEGVVPERLVELMEYAAGTAVPHSLESALSLGMGQRFASKGGYVLPLDALPAPDAPPAGELIVP